MYRGGRVLVLLNKLAIFAFSLCVKMMQLCSRLSVCLRLCLHVCV